MVSLAFEGPQNLKHGIILKTPRARNLVSRSFSSITESTGFALMGPGFTHVGPGCTLGGPGFTLVGPGFIFVVDVTKF